MSRDRSRAVVRGTALPAWQAVGRTVDGNNDGDPLLSGLPGHAVKQPAHSDLHLRRYKAEALVEDEVKSGIPL